MGFVSPRVKTVGAWALLVVVCAFVTMAFFTPSQSSHRGINSLLKFSFVPSIKGWAMKPFVYRALVPQTIALILRICPDSLERSAARSVASSRVMAGVFTRLKWESDYALAYMVCTVLVYLMFLFFGLYASRFVLETNGISVSPTGRRILGSALLMGLPPFFKFTSFLYDPAQLLLFTASLYYVYRRRWLPYLVFFTLTCVNKETAVLLIPIFIWHYPNGLSDGTSRRLLAAQVGIFAAARAVLAIRFRDNPGPFMEFHLFDHNLSVLAGGYGWSPFLLLALLAFVLLYKWNQKPPFLKAALVFTLPALLVISLFVGWIDEWRVYYEAYAVASAIALHTFRSLATPHA